MIALEGTNMWLHRNTVRRVGIHELAETERTRDKEGDAQGAGWILTPVDSVVVRCGAVACSVECFLAPTTRIPRAAPGVVVIGTRSGFHLLLQDHPPDATPNLRGRGRKKTGKLLI